MGEMFWIFAGLAFAGMLVSIVSSVLGMPAVALVQVPSQLAAALMFAVFPVWFTMFCAFTRFKNSETSGEAPRRLLLRMQPVDWFRASRSCPLVLRLLTAFVIVLSLLVLIQDPPPLGGRWRPSEHVIATLAVSASFYAVAVPVLVAAARSDGFAAGTGRDET